LTPQTLYRKPANFSKNISKKFIDDFIFIGMSPVDAIRNYFESMVNYRISSIVSALARLQAQLLSNKDKMTMEEMDNEINKLETIRRVLHRPSQSAPMIVGAPAPMAQPASTPPPPQKLDEKEEPKT
jgi:hypothetical protein